MKYVFIPLTLLSTFALCDTPAWVLDPSMDGKYIGAIGCAKPQKNPQLQKKMALLEAKGAISEELHVSVEDTVQGSTKNEDDMFENEFEFETSQTSFSSFAVKEMDSYTDENNNLCIWIIKE